MKGREGRREDNMPSITERRWEVCVLSNELI